MNNICQQMCGVSAGGGSQGDSVSGGPKFLAIPLFGCIHIGAWLLASTSSGIYSKLCFFNYPFW